MTPSPPAPVFELCGMTRKKRTTLPPLTEQEIAHHPELLRRTRTGWARKCSECGEFASGESAPGRYVCRKHGASPSDLPVPEQASSRPPTGFQGKGRRKERVDELVADYQARRVNPDDTDDDMLYLRAHLEEMKWLLPEVYALHDGLRDLRPRLKTLGGQRVVDGDGATVDEIIDQLGGARTSTRWNAPELPDQQASHF